MLRNAHCGDKFCAIIAAAILCAVSKMPERGARRRREPRSHRPDLQAGGRTRHEPSYQRYRAGFHRRDHARDDQLPRLDRRRLGGPVQPSEEFHAGLHDRTRHHGRAGGRVQEAQRQDHRHFGRSGRKPRQVAGRHQDGDRPRGALSADRRQGSQGRQALRHAAGRRRRHLGRPHARRQRHGALGLSSSGRTRRSSWC